MDHTRRFDAVAATRRRSGNGEAEVIQFTGFAPAVGAGADDAGNECSS